VGLVHPDIDLACLQFRQSGKHAINQVINLFFADKEDILNITEFLHRILTGVIRCPAFPEDFPTTGVQMVFGDVVAVADLLTARHSFLTGDQYIRVMDAWPAPWKTIQEEQRKQGGTESG